MLGNRSRSSRRRLRLSRRGFLGADGVLLVGAVAARRATAAIPPPEVQLDPPARERWRQIAARFPHIQAAITMANLQTGETADLNGDVIHHPGCTRDVLVLMCVL